jgi:hypothetical protein
MYLRIVDFEVNLNTNIKLKNKIVLEPNYAYFAVKF